MHQSIHRVFMSVCSVKSCAKRVSEHLQAAPQVEHGFMVTGTQCPNQSPATAITNWQRERREVEMDWVVEDRETRQMKAWKWRWEKGWRKYGNEIWRLNSEWQWECQKEVWGSIHPFHLCVCLVFGLGFCARQNKKSRKTRQDQEASVTLSFTKCFICEHAHTAQYIQNTVRNTLLPNTSERWGRTEQSGYVSFRAPHMSTYAQTQLLAFLNYSWALR